MKEKYSYSSVLAIAGNDGSGGAGLQADIKTISALGCFATSVLTALPIQNTKGVKKIYPIPEQVAIEQIKAVMDDIFPDAVKIGMVHTPKLVENIAKTLSQYKKVPIVFDPVMISTSGHNLLEKETIKMMVEKLFPMAEIITPNLDEATILAGMDVKTLEDMYKAGPKILALGCKSVLLKGGHLTGNKITSVFFYGKNKHSIFESEKLETENTHGSGCTLSSAIAAYLAQGKNIHEAVDLAQQYVFNAIKNGMDVKIGKGNGPLNHFFDPKKLIKILPL